MCPIRTGLGQGLRHEAGGQIVPRLLNVEFFLTDPVNHGLSTPRGTLVPKVRRMINTVVPQILLRTSLTGMLA